MFFLGVAGGVVISSFEIEGTIADQCDGDDCTPAGENAKGRLVDRHRIALGFAIFGAASVGASVLLWDVGGGERSSGLQQASLTPSLGPNHAQLTLGARW